MPGTATSRIAPSRFRPYGMVEFRAMASPCRIVADTHEFAELGRELVDDLERRWTRFRSDSEVGRINTADGALCRVSPDTFRLFECSEVARVATSGRFNPFVADRLDALRAAVNDRRLGSWAGPLEDPVVIMLEQSLAVQVPSGARFDPGGIGKGLAADLVAERLVAAGSESVQVELGGDVRLVGPGWRSGRWRVDVRDPIDRRSVIATVELGEGAVATSGLVGRGPGSRPVQHLIDPATGSPCVSTLVAVTATSSELWWAEIIAKVALMAGPDGAAAVMEEFGAAGVLVMSDGGIVPILPGAVKA